MNAKVIGTFLAVAVAIALVVSIPWWRRSQKEPPSSKVPIFPVGNEAFGKLEREKLLASSPSEADGTTDVSVVRIAPVPPQPIPVPVPTMYQYVYRGTLTLPDLPVLKRQARTDFSATALVGPRPLGLVDIAGFQNVKPQYFTLAEETGSGYSLSIDYLNGSITLSKSFAASEKIRAESGEPVVATTPEKLPADSELIQIAQQFLDRSGIVTSDFSQPFVRQDWWYLTAETRADVPISEVTVVYPWQINDTMVFDEIGNRQGLNVGVNVLDRSVTSVTNLVTLNFLSSEYPLTKDPAVILEMLKNGGWFGVRPLPAEPQVFSENSDLPIKSPVVESEEFSIVEVGDPTSGYSLLRYAAEDGSSDLLVPALIFPMKDAEQTRLVGRQTVVIPLLKDWLTTGSVSSPSIVEPSGP